MSGDWTRLSLAVVVVWGALQYTVLAWNCGGHSLDMIKLSSTRVTDGKLTRCRNLSLKTSTLTLQ